MIRQTKEGWWIIDGDSHLGKWIEETGRLDHDFFTIPLACQYIPVGGVVMDCGANVGSHSLGYANKLGSSGTLICIEAGDNAYNALCLNAAKFQSTVMLMNVALGKEHGSWADFIEDPKNFGASEVRPFEGKGSKVWTASIDGIMKDSNINHLDFVKIDCEGSEVDILEGSRETLKRFKPTLLIEINWPKLAKRGFEPKDVYKVLNELKYGWTIIQPECHALSEQFDVLCKPS